VGNWSEMQPTGRRPDILPVWVLTGDITTLVLNLRLDVVNLGLHVVNLGLHVVIGVGLSCV
jgi:hypothetical protein